MADQPLPQPQDTGGLGLLQMLAQAGIPPQVLLSLLMAAPPQAPARGPDYQQAAEPYQGAEGGANPNANAEAAQAEEGSVGNAPGTFGAAVSGLGRGGLLGSLLGDMGLPGFAQGPAASAAKMGLSALGVPSLPMGFLNSIAGAMKKAAEFNMRQQGKRVGDITFGGPRTIPDTPPPNATFNDPANFADMGPVPTVPEGIVSLGQMSIDMSDPNSAAIANAVNDAISAAVAAAGDAGPAGDPGGLGEGSGASGPGGSAAW